MKVLTTPWKNDFLHLVEQSRRSIKITSPFVKNDVCLELIKSKRTSTKIYLITSFKLMSIYSGALDISAIENIIDNNGIVRNFPRLHSKIYIFDDEQAIVTSANLTYGGLLKNFEYGVLFDELTMVEAVVRDFNALLDNEITGVVKKSDLEAVRSIIGRIPPSFAPRVQSFEVETPEESLDIIQIPMDAIIESLSGWKLEVFKCADKIPKQTFTLGEINEYEEHLKKLYPAN